MIRHVVTLYEKGGMFKLEKIIFHVSLFIKIIEFIFYHLVISGFEMQNGFKTDRNKERKKKKKKKNKKKLIKIITST